MPAARRHWRVAAAAPVAIVALLCGPQIAQANNLGRPLAAVAHAAGVHLFWRGANGDLWENTQSGGSWSGPTDTRIGGLAGAPTATAGAGGADVVFWEGTDRALWTASTTGGGWSGPTRIGMGPLGSQPAATSWAVAGGQVQFAVVWQGTNAALWEAWYTGGVWEGPRSLGMGPLNSAPTVAALGSSISAFWQGTPPGYSLWSAATSGGPAGAFTGPKYLGMGPLGSAPTALELGSGEVDVFWQGTGGAAAHLWQARETAGKWAGPIEDPPVVASPPTVVAAGSSGYDAFWVGSDDDIWEAYGNASGWSTAIPVGPLVAAAPPASSPASPVTVVIPPPSSRPHALRVRIVIRWRWDGTRTWLEHISFSRMPGATTLTVRCHGHGCPRHAWAATGRRHRHRLEVALERRVYRAGQRLTLTLSAPGWLRERVQLLIRDGALPRARLG